MELNPKNERYNDMKGKMVSFDSDVPSGKDAKEGKHLSTTAREKHATGTNSTSRYKTRHGGVGKLGAKGHPK